MDAAAEIPHARRPLKSRGSVRIRRLAAWLAARGVSPNAISLASIGFAALTATALGLTTAGGPDGPLLVAAALTIQLRLLCNLLDGLVAVEGGLSTPAGELFNDAPDRVSDALVLVAAGYAGGAGWLGWAAALAAVLTAYVRLLGASVGRPQDFSGVMSKPRRMALLTVACLVAVADPAVLAVGCALIAAGSLVTCATRLAAIRRGLG